MKPVEELMHTHLRGLQPYLPGEQPVDPGWVKLNTNEFPYPPPESVVEAIRMESASLARYPNPSSAILREAIAAFYELKVSSVIIGNGSDDLLNLLARAFGGRGRETVQTFPSYSLYSVINAISGGEIRSVPFSGEFKLPVKELIASDPDLLFLTSPNAPTGVRFPLDELKALASGIDGILVVDEAYAEFADGNALPLLAEHGNVIITRTFSKAYGLAGLRVGYALGHAAVIEVLDRIRDSYNVNRLSQAGALAALKEGQHFGRLIGEIRRNREWLRASLMDLGWWAYPSEANFIFASPSGKGAGSNASEMAASLFNWLKKRKILVRYFANHPLTAGYLRISIGSRSELEQFLTEVMEWQKTV